MSRGKSDSVTTRLWTGELEGLDRADREDAIAEALETAMQCDIAIDARCQKLFQRYIDGELTAVGLVAEIKRPHLH
jgi:hypothetical protein